MTNGAADPPHQRVSRWASLLAEELGEVHRLAAGNGPPSDMELERPTIWRVGSYRPGRRQKTLDGCAVTLSVILRPGRHEHARD